MYINTPGQGTTHAEIMFTQQKLRPKSTITNIRVTNSPCLNCARALVTYFQNIRNKPTISVGRIYGLGDPNSQPSVGGLRTLKDAGFPLEVWRGANQILFGPNGDQGATANFLRQLR